MFAGCNFGEPLEIEIASTSFPSHAVDIMIVGSSKVDSKEFPIVTISIVLLCCIVFLKTYMLECQSADEMRKAWHSGSAEVGQCSEQLSSLFDEYGFQWSDLKEGNPISLFTHMFIHVGMMHIAGNMLAFWAFAVALEELFGSFKFALFYLLAGLVACLAEGYFFMEAVAPMVGASGAVAGVMGAYLILFGGLTNVKFLIGYFVVDIPTPLAMIFWLFCQMTILDFDAQGGVAVVAHLAGFASGAAIAFVCKASLTKRIESNEEGEVVIASANKEPEPDEKILMELLETRPYEMVIAAMGNPSIACLKCGEPLDLTNPIGDRLVRCQGSLCSHMTYVDGDILAVALTPKKIGNKTKASSDAARIGKGDYLNRCLLTTTTTKRSTIRFDW